MNAAGWSGAVLTGGASTRMGRDKALLTVGGVAMAARVAAALEAAGAGDVFCVGGNVAGLAAAGLAAHADEHPDEGPLGGIISALRVARHPVVAVVACDLLAPAPDVIAALVAAATAVPAVAVVDGREQWLLAAWPRDALDQLQRAFDAGDRAVRVATRRLPAIVRVVVDAAAAADADTPDQLPESDR